MDFPTTGLQNVDFSGGLGGVFASQNQMDAEKMRGIEMQNKGLMNTYQQLQNERYGQATPLELQKLGGEADIQRTAGNVAKATEKTTIDQKIAESLKGKTEAELGQYAADSEKMVTQLTAAKARLAQGMPPEQIAQGLGIDLTDPNMQQKYGKILSNPSALPGTLDKIIKMYQQVGLNSTKHLQEMTKQSEKILSDEKIAKGHDNTSLEVARIHAASSLQAARDNHKGGGVDKGLDEAARIISNPNATVDQIKAAQKYIDTVVPAKMSMNPASQVAPQIIEGGKIAPGKSPYQAMMENKNIPSSGGKPAMTQAERDALINQIKGNLK